MSKSQYGSAPVFLQLETPVAHISLEDRVHGNRITEEILAALPAAFSDAVAHPEIHVILLTGLPDVFCAGATREMLAVDEEPRTAVGWKFVRVVADCVLPVVAAVQGNAIGGGLLFALYADVVVLSERSSYSANFLSYGFTPFLGATYLLPAVMGHSLGTEMLYTARPYRGRELAARGAGVQIVAHDDVIDKSRRIAHRIAQAPRESIELLKRDLSSQGHQHALAARDREWSSHVRTLASAEAQRRIAALYPDIDPAEIFLDRRT